MKEIDVVGLKKDMPQKDLKEGDTGTIIFKPLYSKEMEVEFWQEEWDKPKFIWLTEDDVYLEFAY